MSFDYRVLLEGGAVDCSPTNELLCVLQRSTFVHFILSYTPSQLVYFVVCFAEDFY